MNKEQLKELARAGVIARLTAMQTEINELAAEFPELVKNADGSTPSVMPMVPKATATAALKRPKTTVHLSKDSAAYTERVRAYLAAHPNSKWSAIAAGLGVNVSSSALKRAMDQIARVTGTANRAPGARGGYPAQVWALKGNAKTKTTKTNGKTNGANAYATVPPEVIGGRQGKKKKRINPAKRLEPAREYLRAHPNATTQEVAQFFNTYPSKSFTKNVLGVVANATKAARASGSGYEYQWQLKD